jgi:hypothetical protein
VFGFRNGDQPVEIHKELRARIWSNGDGAALRRQRSSRMQTPNNRQEKKRKSYKKPTATKLTMEQAKLKAMGHAMMGDEGAMELLHLMFPDEPSKNSTDSKKAS